MSTSTILAMLLFIGLTSSISSVAGLKCWTCHTDGKTCAETTEEITCTDPPRCVRRFKGDKKMYWRGCADKTYSVGCIDIKEGHFEGQQWCICDTELCNGDREGNGKVNEAGQLQTQTNGTSNSENSKAKDSLTGASHDRRHSSLLISGFALLVPLLVYFQ